MNVYDTANKLAQEIKESQEYKEYKNMKDEIMTNPELKSKIEEFEKLRYDIQLMQYSGEQKDEGKMKKLEDMYKILIVEDDRIIADNVCEQLLKWGYDVKIADDINVLIAKVQAMLRRTYSFAESTNIIEHNGCILNLNDQTFTYNGKRIELTKNEYHILQSLLENIGKVVSRDNIMMKLWESDDFIDDNTLTVNVTRLRKKLEQAGLIDYIKTKKVPEYRQI